MANPEHIGWLKKGVEDWNERRKYQSFQPDLSEEDLSRALGRPDNQEFRHISVHLGELNLVSANLNGATLKDTDLKNGNLFVTQFADANLAGTAFTACVGVGTKFNRANLESASLQETKFYKSDFSSAQLLETDLKDALFWDCTFNDAHLYSANVAGAKFIKSRPWTARLFCPTAQNTIDIVPFHKEGIVGINDLLDSCRELREAYGEHATLYFRGEGRQTWDLRPSVMRNFGAAGKSLRTAESQMLNDLMTRQPDSFDGVTSAIAQWVFAQHHGLKTRLLDITRNPLVALFNACADNEPEDGKLHAFAVPRSLIKPFNSDTIRVIANFAKLPRGDQNLLLGKSKADSPNDEFPPDEGPIGRTIASFERAKEKLCDIIRKEGLQFEDKIDIRDFFRVLVVEPQHIFERLKAQSGAFLISAFHERFETDEVLRRTQDLPIYAHHTLTVPKEKKHSIIGELRLLNVTREVLLPSVDESADAITGHYLHRGNSV